MSQEPALARQPRQQEHDSGSAGMVMGAAAMAAAKLAQEGASLEDCHAAAVDTVKRGKTWVYLNSTEDLRRSGRRPRGRQ